MNFVCCLSLFQTVIPIETIGHGINPVGWFLSALFICYIFCLPLFRFIIRITQTEKGCLISFIISVVITIAVFAVLSDIQVYIPIFNTLTYSTPYIRIFFFLLGALLARLRNYHSKEIKYHNYMQVVASFIVIVYFFSRNTLSNYCNIVLLRSIDIFSCMLFCYYMSFEGIISGIFQGERIVKWGQDAMYYYLIQFPAIWLVDFIFRNLETTLLYGILHTILYILLTLLSGYLLKIVSRKHIAHR